jgi:hypothetical protein
MATRKTTSARAPLAKPTLRLVQAVPRPACTQTVAILQRLLTAALAGDVVGLVYGAMGPGGAYHVDVAGLLERSPTLGRGVCAALDDELQALVNERSQAAPDFEW